MRQFYRLAVLAGLFSASATASATAPPEPATSYAAQTAVSVTPAAYMTIPERFSAEVGQRPSGTLRVEEVTAAFRKASLTIEDEKQHLASTPENDVTAKKPLATSSALKRPALPRRNRQGIR